MKLYTFLLIYDSLMEDERLFKVTDYTAGGYYIRENRIYTYVENKEIVFMRFKYPNIDNHITPYNIWAYTLIDNTLGKKHILKQRWSSNIDKKGKRTENDNIKIGDFTTKKIKYLRVGGHIGNTKYRLHEYIYKCKYGNTLNPKKDRIHHIGHSFDNRLEYLKLVNISKHRYIHNKLEPENNYCRPRGFTLGLEFNKSSVCGYKIGMKKKEYIKHCQNCSSVLVIDTEAKLQQFINDLNSQEYKELLKICKI